MITPLKVAIAATALIFFSPKPYAQVVVIEAEKISSEVDLSRTMTILNEEDIQRKNPTSLVEVLRDIPGVEIIRQGPTGQFASVFIRGAKSEATLVLIDGVPANDVTAPGGGFDFASLSPNRIGRIEVYRGPQGVRFGSGALGGVINIITREGTGPRVFDYLVEAGSYKTSTVSIGSSGREESFSYSIGIDEVRTDGFSAAGEKYGATESDGGVARSAAAKLTWQPDGRTKVEGTTRYLKSEFDLDRSGGTGDDPNYTGEGEQTLAGLSAEDRFFSDRLHSKLAISFMDSKRSLDNATDAGAVDTADALYKGEQWQVDMGHKWIAGERHSLRLDIQWKQEQAEIESLFTDQFGTYPGDIPNETQSIIGEGITYFYNNGRVFADIGLRSDQIHGFTSVTSSRVSLGRVFREQNAKITAAVGTGFKLPTLYQLYAPTYGNADLEIEKSTSAEVTLEKKLGSRDLTSMTAFNHEFSSMIDFLGSQYANVDRARSRGFELQSEIQLNSNLTVVPSFTYLEAEDLVENERLLRRPRELWNIKVDYSKGPWGGYIEYRYRGERIDSDPISFTRVRNPSYEVVDLGIEYNLRKELKVHLRAENLFDEEYEESMGYGTPGASFYAGVSGEL